MNLKDIVSISGKPGLYQIISKRKNGFIVESLDFKARRFPTNPNQRVSILDEISVFTDTGDLKILEVLVKMYQQIEDNGLEMPTKGSSSEEIVSFFEQILPNFDRERVYNSDILKLCVWYKILSEQMDLSELKLEEKEEEKSEEKSEEKAKDID